MKKYGFFVGIDVSKKTLDACLIKAEDSKHAEFIQVANSMKGYGQLLQWITKKKLCLEDGLFILEHTGIYSLVACMFLQKSNITYSLIPGLVIKKSMGILRGKNDQKDAFYIARYGMLYKDQLQIRPMKEETIVQLQVLYSQRRRLVNYLKGLQVYKKELADTGLDNLAHIVEENQSQTVQALKLEIKGIDKQMQALIDENENFKKQYELCTSIPGVGQQLGTYLIIVTHAFSRFNNARALACYGGVAPFPHQSGTSIKGKNRISPFADKQLKSLLHMASLNAVRCDKELKIYYERKLKEGQNAMWVLNAVRNKVLARVFATVKRETPYVALAQHA